MEEPEDPGDPTQELLRRRMNRRKALSTGAKVGVAAGVAAVAAGVGGYFGGLASAPPGTVRTVTAPTQTVTTTVTTTPTTTIAQPEYGGTMTVRLPYDPATFNLAITSEANAILALSQMFNGLVKVDLDWNIRPDLAESWDISPDTLTSTFHLVRNAKWHDGEPFTSADVKFSIEEVISKLHPFTRAVFANLDVVDTPDDYTAIIRLKRAFPPLLLYLPTHYCSIIPKHLYEGTDVLTNPYATGEKLPVGTGAFKMTEYVRGSHILYERNPDYFKAGLPYLDKVVMKIIPDAQTMMGALYANEIEFIRVAVDPADVPVLEADPRFVVSGRGVFEGNGSVTMIALNQDNAILRNKKVAQAMMFAIDRKEIAVRVARDVQYASYGPIHRRVDWPRQPDLPTYEYNLQQAESLLDEAGYPRGGDGNRFTVTLDYFSGLPVLRLFAESCASYLRQAGIAVEERPFPDFAGLAKKVFTDRDFDTYSLANPSGPDAATALRSHYHSSTIGLGPFTNATGYKNPEIDQLFDEAVVAVDRDQRVSLVAKIQSIVMEDLPVLPIMDLRGWNAWRKEFQGMPNGLDSTDSLESVWRKSG